jgi:hypothetical protein
MRCFVLLVLISIPLGAPADDQKPAALSPEEIAQLIGPGPEHAALGKFVGDWDVSIKMGPASYAGEAKARTTVGKRFLQVEYQAKGKADATEGMFTLGFDRRHKEYALIAQDSFGTYFVTSQGKRDDKTGKLRLLGRDDDPQMKAMGLTKEFLHVVDLSNPDQLAIEVWFIDTRTPARKEIKFMEYQFKRKA